MLTHSLTDHDCYFSSSVFMIAFIEPVSFHINYLILSIHPTINQISLSSVVKGQVGGKVSAWVSFCAVTVSTPCTLYERLDLSLPHKEGWFRRFILWSNMVIFMTYGKEKKVYLQFFSRFEFCICNLLYTILHDLLHYCCIGHHVDFSGVNCSYNFDDIVSSIK